MTISPALEFAGGVHESEARQKGWQVQPEMAFGGGLAAAVSGPVQTAGDQLNGGRVHEVNHPFEAEGQARAAAPPKAGVEGRGRPRRGLGPSGEERSRLAVERPFLLGGVAAANGRERSRVQAQGVTDFVETEGVGELGEDQTQRPDSRA